MGVRSKIWTKSLGMMAVSSTLALSAGAGWAADLTVWCWDPNFNGSTMEKAFAIYQASHPEDTLTIEYFDKTALEQKMQTQLAAGVTDGLPDIVLVGDEMAQKFLLAFPGAFEPLTDELDYAAMAPNKVAVATVDGETYSMPFDSGVTGYFYRSDILGEAGYTAADLEDITWDRLIEIGQDVLQKTGKQLLPIDTNDAGPLLMMMQSAGGWYFDAEGNPTIKDNAALRATLETYARLVNSGIVKPVNGWPEYTGSFTSGETLSTYIGVWITGTIKANADQAGKWAVAPIPRLDGVPGAVNASNLGGSSWYVFADAPNKDDAIDFLKTVWGADIDFYQQILVENGAVGSLMTARDGEAYQAVDDFFGGQPVWQNFSTWLSEIPPINFGIYTQEANAALVGQLPALLAGGDVDEIIDAIDAQVQAQIQ